MPPAATGLPSRWKSQPQRLLDRQSRLIPDFGETEEPLEWVNFWILERGDSTTLTRRSPSWDRQLTPSAQVEGMITFIK